VYQWRVTKYDPRRRNRRGHFSDDDWTAVSDIGQEYDGRMLTLEEYLVVETAYVDAALHFLRESGVDALTVVGLESDGSVSTADDPASGIELAPELTLRDGQQVSGAEVEQTIRLNLRSLIWCKLEEPGRFFIHFGHDYYMYIGSESPSPTSIDYARRIGLFVEPTTSPYVETIA
jgi:hypothetical protein